MEIPTNVAYRIETRRASKRSPSGRFAQRHDLPAVVVLESGPDHLTTLAAKVAERIVARPGAAAIDRILIERIGTVEP